MTLIDNHTNALSSLTWTSIICTSTAVRTLHDYINMHQRRIPWPGEATAGQLKRLQERSFHSNEVVARVLSERIQDGRLNIAEAELLATKLNSNGNHVYGKQDENESNVKL